MALACICRWVVWIAASCCGLVASAQAAQPLGYLCGSEPTDVRLAADQSVALEWGPGKDQKLLLLEEQGHGVRIATPALQHIDVPPRLGWWFGLIDRQSLVSFSDVRPDSVVRLTCLDPQPALQAWLERASALGLDLGTHVGSTENDALEQQQFHELIETAPDRRMAALATHLQAQALLMSGQSAAAGEAFAVATVAWRAVDERLRETAARLARVEDLNRTGAHRSVLQETTPQLLGDLPDTYYRARLLNARCVAQSKLGAFDAAADCYSLSIKELQRLNEHAEVVVARVDLGTLRRKQGAHDDARSSFLQARSDAIALGSWNAAGRAEYGLGDLACDSAELGECLSRLHLSVEFFQFSRSHRWEASALHRLAQELSRMGAFEDAEQVLASALPLTDQVNAPALWANAQIEQARVLEARSDVVGARAAIEAAIGVYRRIGNFHALETARVLRDRVALRGSPMPSISIHREAVSAPSNRAAVTLNEAEVAIRSGNTDVALSILGVLASSNELGLSDRMRALQLEIRAAAGSPNAHAVIQKSLVSARQLLAATRSPRLQWIAKRSLQPLRIDAVDGWIRHYSRADDTSGAEFDEAALETLLGWLVIDALNFHPAPSVTQPGHADKPRAVTQFTSGELLAALNPELESNAGRMKARTLLAIFADEAGKQVVGANDESQATVLPSLRARLDANERVLIPLRGREHWLFILLGAADTRVVTLVDATKLDAQLRKLSSELARRESDARQIFELADALSRQVMTPLSVHETIDHLYIAHTELAAELPWSLLSQGNGDHHALTASWNLLNISSGEPWPGRRDIEPVLHMHFAAQAQGKGGLTTLTGIDAELEGLRAQFQDRLAVNRTGRAQAWLADIGRPGAWVHLSAHGNLSAGRIAGSGIWFDPIEQNNGAMPEYLSWLDLVEHRVQAELLVLNACQLAPAEAVNPGFSGNLATSLISSGARHVISARWPVSDSAARIWTPAFYSKLAEVPDSPAVALSAARQALRQSRAFRHPYHWAGWVHHEHWRLQAGSLRIASIDDALGQAQIR